MELLIFLLLAGAFIYGLMWLIRYANAQQAKRRESVHELARTHGWTIDTELPGSVDYRIHGETAGIRWQVIAETTGRGKHRSSSTKWTCDEIQEPDLMAMIRSSQYFALMQGRWGRAAAGVLEAMVRAMGVAQPQHAELARDGTRLDARARDVAENYAVVVRPGFEGMLTEEVENALLKWHEVSAHKESLSVDVGQTNLRVYANYLLDGKELLPMIYLGLAIARSLKQGG